MSHPRPLVNRRRLRSQNSRLRPFRPLPFLLLRRPTTLPSLLASRLPFDPRCVPAHRTPRPSYLRYPERIVKIAVRPGPTLPVKVRILRPLRCNRRRPRLESRRCSALLRPLSPPPMILTQINPIWQHGRRRGGQSKSRILQTPPASGLPWPMMMVLREIEVYPELSTGALAVDRGLP